jgi:tetratricopeptide (TPR) repeat protein
VTAGAPGWATQGPLPRLLVAGVLVTIWLAWAALDGGYWPSAWGPLGIVLVATTLLAFVNLRPRWAPRDTASGALLVMLWLFVGWNLLSLTWARFPADAWAGSNTTLLYALGLTLLSWWRWSPAAAAGILAFYSLGVAALGLGTLARALVLGATESFADGRLVGPAGYVNASVALWTCALWPAVFLAASRRMPIALRAALLASAGLMLQLALLGQSRAWFFALPASALLALGLARARLRLLLALGLAGVAAAVSAPVLLDVRGAVLAGPPSPELGRAALAIALAVLVLASAAAVWGLVDRTVRTPARTVRRIGAAVAALAAALVLVSVVVAVRGVDSPRTWAAQQWDDFTRGSYPEGDRLSGSLASNRYQHWRIAWAEFRARPVVGNGVDNYRDAYLLRRDSPAAEPRYPHSWILRLLSQVGLVGTALFAGFVAAAWWLALGARRRLAEDEAAVVGAGLVVFGYWLVHGAVDWLWEIPAVAAPALGLLGLAASVSSAGETVSTGRPAGRDRAAAYGIALAVTLALALPWLAYLHQRAGVAVWRTSPELADARLERAAALNPLDGEPLLLKGSIALRRGDRPTAVNALLRVLEREPRNWYAHFQLALATADGGDFEQAERLISRARELNPVDPIVAEAAESISARRPVDIEGLNRRYRDLVAERVDRPGA